VGLKGAKMFEVVYESVGGNTRKLAAIIAEELGMEKAKRGSEK